MGELYAEEFEEAMAAWGEVRGDEYIWGRDARVPGERSEVVSGAEPVSCFTNCRSVDRMIYAVLAYQNEKWDGLTDQSNLHTTLDATLTASGRPAIAERLIFNDTAPIPGGIKGKRRMDQSRGKSSSVILSGCTGCGRI